MAEQTTAAPTVPATTTTANVPGTPGQKATDLPANGNGAQQSPQYFDVKINGAVRRMSIDEMRNYASLGGAATERFEKASAMDKKHQAWKQSASKNAIQALMDPELGLSKDQIRSQFEQWYKQEFIEPETMTREQRDAMEWKKKAEDAQAEKAEWQRQQQEQMEQQEHHKLIQQMQTDIIGALEKSDLPKNRFTVGRMAYWQQQNLKRGYDAPMEVVIQQVKDERQAIVKNQIGDSTPEQIIELLGEELIKKIRQFDIKRLKQKINPQSETQPDNSTIQSRGTAKTNGTKTMRDVDNYFNELRRSKK